MENNITSIIVRAGIIIGLGALVGLLLTHVVMLANFLRRIPRGKIAVREFLAVFFTGGLGKGYMALLVESHMEPTGFDKMLYMLDRIFTWVFIGSIVLLVIGFIGKIEG